MMKRSLVSVFAMLILFTSICIPFSSCSRLLGWGVLLWSSEDPAIPSGTLLPVYIKSNIDQVWVVGIPEQYKKDEKSIDKFEIPLWKLELVGSKKAAEEWAKKFSGYSRTYAETLQDGLPIRESADNNARRIYRLRGGQIVKILDQVEGVPAVGASGAPLPGNWYKVLTEDGSIGYCFSYRLKMFEHTEGQLVKSPEVEKEEADTDLDMIFAQKWYPDWYGTMINKAQIDLADISKQWNFNPGQDSGIAHIYIPRVNRTFNYTSIKPSGTRSWVFEGTSLQMTLRSDTTLAVQFTEGTGTLRTQLFVTIPINIDDIITQETGRREALFQTLLSTGPVFHSENYGTLTFQPGNSFSWIGYNLLVPQTIPASVEGRGTADMGLFLSASLQTQYTGAMSLQFYGADQGKPATLYFMYTIDSQGIRLEYVPESSLDGNVVTRRAVSPIVMYFYKMGQ